VDEVEGAAQLKAERQVAAGVGGGEPAALKLFQGGPGERHRQRRIAGGELAADVVVERLLEPVEEIEEEGGFDERPVGGAEVVQADGRRSLQPLQACVHPRDPALHDFGTGRAGGRSGQSPVRLDPFRAERVGEHRPLHLPEHFPVRCGQSALRGHARLHRTHFLLPYYTKNDVIAHAHLSHPA